MDLTKEREKGTMWMCSTPSHQLSHSSVPGKEWARDQEEAKGENGARKRHLPHSIMIKSNKAEEVEMGTIRSYTVGQRVVLFIRRREIKVLVSTQS